MFSRQLLNELFLNLLAELIGNAILQPPLMKLSKLFSLQKKNSCMNVYNFFLGKSPEETSGRILSLNSWIHLQKKTNTGIPKKNSWKIARKRSFWRNPQRELPSESLRKCLLQMFLTELSKQFFLGFPTELAERFKKEIPDSSRHFWTIPERTSWGIPEVILGGTPWATYS